MLSNLLCESEEFINEPENTMINKVHRDELNLLQEICDFNIALHSVELAVHVCCDLTYQSRAQVLIFSPEIILNKSQWQNILPSELHWQGSALLERFKSLEKKSDMEEAIAMQRKAIIFTPLNSVDRPKMLSTLGISYRCRYEWFGFKDVKDFDSAIRQQIKALASVPRDSSDRPEILMNFGNVY